VLWGDITKREPARGGGPAGAGIFCCVLSNLVLCCTWRCPYSVGGEALLTGGASCSLIFGKGGCDMTTSEVLELCLVIIGICGLFLQVYSKKK